MRGIFLLLVVLSIAPAALAQAPSPEELYAQAQQHFLARRYTEALPLFESLRDKHQSPNARLYVARCYQELGRYPEAYEEMAVTKEEAGKLAKKEQRYAATHDAAQKELGKLREKVALLQLRPAGAYKDLEIEINGRFYRNPARLKKPIPVMPGAVRVHASAPGFDDSTSDLEADPSRLTDVAIILTPQPSYVAEVAKKREQSAKQKKLKEAPRTHAAAPPPRMPRSSRGCAMSASGGANRLIMAAIMAALLVCRRRAGVDARRLQPVHSKTTHGRAPRTRRRDRGVAAPPRPALGARQAGGRLRA